MPAVPTDEGRIMRAKRVQLSLTPEEFKALHDCLKTEDRRGRMWDTTLTDPALIYVYRKTIAIQYRLDTAEKLLERIPLREA